MNNYLINVIDFNGKSSPQVVSSSQTSPFVLSAEYPAKYDIIDVQTGIAPKNIQLLQVNNSLQIVIDNSAGREFINIENYFDFPQSSLIGKKSVDQYYEYVANADVAANVDLYEYSNVSLGSTPISSPFIPTITTAASASSSFSSLFMVGGALAGVGVIAAAAGGSSSKDDKKSSTPNRAPQPETPTVIAQAPTDITLSTNIVTENVVGATIGTLTTTDTDSTAHTYTVSDNRFEIVNDTLKLKNNTSLDFEATPFVKVKITATDNTNKKISKNFTVKVKDVDETPATLTIQKIANDNRVSVTEAKKNIEVVGTTEANNTVVVKVGSASQEVTANTNGVYRASFAGSELQQDNDYKVVANLKNKTYIQATKKYTLDDYAAASIEITNVSNNGLSAQYTSKETQRLNGSLDLSNSLFNTGFNKHRIKSIDVKIAGKTYSSGINDGKFDIDIPTNVLTAAHGSRIKYSLNFNEYVLDYDNAYVNRFSIPSNKHAILNIATKKMTAENAGIKVTFDDTLVKNNNFQTAKLLPTKVLVSGKASGVAAANDVVTLKLADKTYTAKLANDKIFQVVIELPTTNTQQHIIEATLVTKDNDNQKVTVSTSENLFSAATTNTQMVSGANITKNSEIPYYFLKALSAESDPQNINNTKWYSDSDTYVSLNNKQKTIKYFIASRQDGLATTDINGKKLNNPADFSDNNKKGIKNALKTIEKYSAIKFKEVDQDGDDVLGYYMVEIAANKNVSSGYTSGYAYYGNDVYIASRIYGAANIANVGDLLGKQGSRTALHETLHTIGFKHPFADDDHSSSAVLTPGNDESTAVTVMSYNTDFRDNDFVGSSDIRLFDLAYLHYRYGVNTSQRAGNDVYGFKNFNPNTVEGDVYIWDGAGSDTFDASHEKKSVHINLTPGSMSYRGSVSEVQQQNDNKFSITKTLHNGDLRSYFTEASQLSASTKVVNAFKSGDTGLSLSSLKNNEKDKTQETYAFSQNQTMIGFGTQIEHAKGSAFNDTITGNKADNIIYGNAGNDTITGDAGNDYLDGGTGNDTLTGGVGNDVYVVDSSNDVVKENANAGNDLVITSSEKLTLANNIENVLMVDGALQLTGNTLANNILGNSKNNIIIGGAGDDVINGGAGSDTLTGGAGKDTFVFTNQLDGSVDTITDFVVADDVIKLDDDIFTNVSQGNVLGNISLNASTGELGYKKDAGADAVVFAKVDANISFTEDNFVVV